MPPPGYGKSVTRFKVEQVLSPEHLKEYQALLKDARTTVKKAHAWLVARGYRVGYAAVGRHRRRYDEDVIAMRKTAMLAEHLADESKAGGLSALSDATVARFQQVLLERLMRLDKADDPDAEQTRNFSSRDWLELGRTINAAVSARRSLETLRLEFDDRARKAAEAAPKGRLDGVALSDKVRRILGVPLPGEPTPGLPVLGPRPGPAPAPRPGPMVPPGEN